ncbi:sensor histidine kinase [Leifsonia sp. A12D58]|uniref:sensor histidine kinase n=1 Tax=Leifsonia sp. A12D58 TaxID=3397674 RepID=UPI0039E1AE5A
MTSSGRNVGVAAERMTRVMYAAIGLIALVFGSLSIQSVVAQFPVYSERVSIIVWALVFGLPLVLGLVSPRAPIQWMRMLALASGGVFLGALLTAFLMPVGPFPEAYEIPWICTFTGLPALCIAAAVTDVRLIWGYAALASMLGGWVRAKASTDPHAVLLGFEDALYSFLLVSVVVGLTLATKLAAARLDAAVTAARSDHAARAARIARKQERLIIDAVVHDSVISTLLLAGRNAVPANVLSKHASSTLAQLDELGVPHPEETVTGADLVTRLATVMADLDDSAVFEHEVPAGTIVPSDVAAAMVGAASEAFRNSVACAQGSLNRSVARTVVARVTGTGFRIVVRDDGVGFELSKVPAERLGIAQSIIGRMERISGGSARVTSRPGRGTEVVITWLNLD